MIGSSDTWRRPSPACVIFSAMRRSVVVVLAALVLAACGGTDDSGTIATTAPVATVTTVGVTTTTVADGRVPAYLKTLDVAARQLTYDQIQFLIGAEAKKAWVKDHPDEPDGPPNDYYIVNVNPQLYTVTIAPDAADHAQRVGRRQRHRPARHARAAQGRHAKRTAARPSRSGSRSRAA